MKKITFCIPVKNRDEERIQRCVNSLQSKWTEEILICDYGSKYALGEIKGATIFRYTKNKIWNKSHAINLMIKKAKGKFIATVDCDMIIHPRFIETATSYLDMHSFVYTLNVRRLKKANFRGTFFTMLDKSHPWVKGGGRVNINHTADGGIQVYPKRWIKKIWGLDEALVYWGGIDNDVSSRAILCGMVMINLNLPVLHQDHKAKKEEHLEGQEKIDAFRIRIEKVKYLDRMFKKKKVKRNRGGWGKEFPNQKHFLKQTRQYLKEQEEFKEKFQEASQRGAKTFQIGGKTYKIFK